MAVYNFKLVKLHAISSFLMNFLLQSRFVYKHQNFSKGTWLLCSSILNCLTSLVNIHRQFHITSSITSVLVNFGNFLLLLNPYQKRHLSLYCW